MQESFAAHVEWAAAFFKASSANFLYAVVLLFVGVVLLVLGWLCVVGLLIYAFTTWMGLAVAIFLAAMVNLALGIWIVQASTREFARISYQPGRGGIAKQG